MKTLYFLLSICLPLLSYGQANIEKQIASYAIPLTNPYDFSFSDSILKDKRIIIMGEKGHADGSTFKIRTAFIKYLSQKFGFNVVGLETFGFILSNTFYPQEKSDKLSQVDITTDWNFLWSNTVECQPFVEAVNQRKIEVFGFDIIQTQSLSTIDSLQALVYKFNPRISQDIDWEKFKKVHTDMQHVLWGSSFTTEQQCYLVSTLNSLKNNIRNQMVSEKTASPLADTLLQCLRNVSAQYQDSKYQMQSDDFVHDNHLILLSNNIRDKQMAENIIWYMKKHPDKKVIIWCASFHGAKDISQCIKQDEPTMYARLKTMGEYLAEEFGEKLYSMAFTYPESEHPDALENRVTDSGTKFAYIDFVPLRYNSSFFNEKFKSCAMMYKTGKWMQIFDGMYIIRDWEISTPLKKVGFNCKL